jgi:hypothetical protein
MAAEIALLAIAGVAAIGFLTALALTWRNERRAGYVGQHRVRRGRSPCDTNASRRSARHPRNATVLHQPAVTELDWERNVTVGSGGRTGQIPPAPGLRALRSAG